MIKLWPALFAALLGGCQLADLIAERQALTKAEFSFKSAAITRADVPVLTPDPRADLAVTLAVKNPNRVAAALDRVDYQVLVGGQTIGTGTVSSDFRVEPGATRDLVLPVSVRYEGLAAPVIDALLRREFDVAVRGTSHLTTPIGTLDFPLEVQGRAGL